ncbi:MAG TPA: patatin-like phospholipase family protein [Terriglobales bacterium]|nr:patatin-like phospholipase family protein [Terriglobales bacterium]
MVLEGGAALGLAHIGVLQWLEEHRIPISYVAGASMGGLVGGLYATGESPAEIRSLVEEINWDEVLHGGIPFTDLAFRRKEDAEEYPNRLEFGIRQGIRFPEGFNSGHQVGLILDRISLPYSEIKSFDDLPIPFACVATDLVSRKEHVFREGSLAQALRSTMSLPGIFTPVRTGSAIFVDGGLLDNLPVDVAKDMGADITIAIHLQVKSLEADQTLSSIGVLGQSVSAVISANELRSIQKADILISVPLAGYDSSDYKKSASIIRLGYEAATSKAAILSRLGLDEAGWQKYRFQREARRKDVARPQFIEVTGTKPALAKGIQRTLSNNVGQPVDPARLDRQLTSLLGIGRYSRLGYRMVERDDQQGLLIVADEKEYGPPLVRPLVVIDGTEYERVQFILGARLTFLDVGAFGSEWRNDVTLGSEYAVKSEFFRPFGEQLQWFVAPRAFAENDQDDFYMRETLIAEYRDRQAGAAFDVGRLFGRTSKLRIGYQAGEQRYSPSVGSAIFGTLQGRTGTTSLRFNRIGTDDPIIPSRGFDLHFRTEWNGASPGAKAGFPLAETQMTAFQPLNFASSVFFSAAGGTTFTYHPTGIPPFSLGGSRNLVAYGTNEFLTDQYFLFKTGYIRKLWHLPPLLGDKIYALGTYELGKVYDLPKVPSLPTDAACALVINTIFGPVVVGGAFGATGHYKFFYRVGRVF